ncbi:MAG TPA: hypothetical protein VHB48_08870, partial [Chitinophagaceae bacterium]|nr:hypothetical protein [Chitinophagaceae bacterium]
MKKIKYFYNTHTLRYEKLVTPLRVKLLRVFAFLATAVVTAGIIVSVAFHYIKSPGEKELTQQNDALQENYALLQQQVQQLQQKMGDLEKRDNEVYRSIFESSPIPDSARMAEMIKSKEIKLVQNMSEQALVSSITSQLNNLILRVAYQQKSYNDITTMVKNKQKL